MGRTTFTNATVFDGLHEPVTGQTVVVDSGRIAAIGSEVDAPNGPLDGDVHVDASGLSLLPGMFLCHFHTTYYHLDSRFGPLGGNYPPSFQAVMAARNLKLALERGFTGIVSAGASYDIEPGLKQAIAEGIAVGPRFVPSGRELSTTGHSNDIAPWYWGHTEAGAIRICDGAEGFRLGVRDEVRRGAEVIKLFVTGGHGTFSPRERMEMTWEEMGAAVEAAHGRGVMIRGHITNKPAIMKAIEFGLDIIDHCDEMDDEVIAALAETGIAVAPSVQLPKAIYDSGAANMLGFDAEEMRADIEHTLGILPAAHAAGVNVLLGDDYGAPGLDHGTYGGEFRTYVEGTGLPLHEILKWATINPAQLLDKSDELGTLEVGKIADVVVVEGNPAEDLSVLSDRLPLAVLMDGDVVAGALPTRVPAPA